MNITSIVEGLVELNAMRALGLKLFFSLFVCDLRAL